MSFFPKEIASSASGIFLLEEALQFSLEETVLSRLGAAKSDPFQKSKVQKHGFHLAWPRLGAHVPALEKDRQLACGLLGLGLGVHVPALLRNSPQPRSRDGPPKHRFHQRAEGEEKHSSKKHSSKSLLEGTFARGSRLGAIEAHFSARYYGPAKGAPLAARPVALPKHESTKSTYELLLLAEVEEVLCARGGHHRPAALVISIFVSGAVVCKELW